MERLAAAVDKRLGRLWAALARCGGVPETVWADPFAAGFLARHIWLGGQDAQVWRFGPISPRLPTPEEFQAALERGAAQAFGSEIATLAERIALWTAREPADPDLVRFEAGVRAADRLLGRLTGEDWARDKALQAGEAAYKARKRAIGASTFFFNAGKLYAYLAYRALGEAIGFDAYDPEASLARLLPERPPRA